jgi:hypothetical protein
MRPRFGTSRHLAPLTAALLVAGLLSGCGADNPKPPPLPTPTNTATAPTEPALPDAAKGTTKAAAVEFVKYYVAQLSYATSTGKTEGLAKLGADGCKSCTALVDRITSIYSAGGHAQGEGYSISTSSSRRQGAAVVVDGELVNLPQRVWMSEKSAPQDSPESNVLVSFVLARKGESWQIEQWTRVGNA